MTLDPALKAKFRRITASIVKYVEVAHGMSLAGLVCEFVRDQTGEIYLLAVLHTEWSSATAVGSTNLAHAGRHNLAAPHVFEVKAAAAAGNAAGRGGGAASSLERTFASMQTSAEQEQEEEDPGEAALRAAGLRRVSGPGTDSVSVHGADASLSGYDDADELGERDASPAGHVVGLEETDVSDPEGWERRGSGVFREGAASLSAEMSSPRLLPRRTPSASISLGTSSALDRARELRNSADGSITAGRHSSAAATPFSTAGNRPTGATRVRPGSAVPQRTSYAASVAASDDPSLTTSPRRRAAAQRKYTTHAAAERFMPMHGVYGEGNQAAASAHLSAIKANAAAGSVSGGASDKKTRPLSASAAAALRHGHGGTARGDGVSAAAGYPLARGSVPTGGTRPGVAFGGQAGGDVKRAGRPAMRSQLGQDLDATLDELHFQSELADASAAKLAALEEDRASVVKVGPDPAPQSP